jgi:hypothetical protein
MLTLLGFGSSARRGATGWTDGARVRWVIDTAQPDLVVDGASPAGGADQLVHDTAQFHFALCTLDPDHHAIRCPVDTLLDGPWPRAGMRRNERMYRTHRPGLAAGFVSGKVGTPLSSGSAHMAGICLAGLPGLAKGHYHAFPCAVVVYRDDGVEPYSSIAVAHRQLQRLYAATKDRALIVPGKALRSMCECGDPPPDEVLASLEFARDGSRWAPWLDAVIATVRR